MKLSRNRIRKIRKQQHQSVRRWKKQHKASARRSTFRQSRHRRSGSIITKNTPKVVNRTLKKYVSDDEIREIKEKYRKLRRDKRKKRQQVGGEITSGFSPEMLQAAVTAAATAAATATVEIVLKQQQSSKDSPLKNDNGNVELRGKANNETPTTSIESTSTTTTPETTTKDNNDGTSSTPKSKDAVKKPPFQLGPEIEGDISIGMEEHECNDKTKVYELVKFLIQKGLPYYVQIHLKAADKALNKNDTNIFDLRRVLYGKFTQDIKKVYENKRKLYLEPKETVGIANSELYGSSEPGLFIYTGEKGQILKDSKDTSIQVRLLQEDPNAAPIPPLSDSNRLYKITGKGTDTKPDSINTVKKLTNLDRDNKIDMSEFRLQIAPMTPEELKKDAQKVASGNNSDPEAKVVVDESNTYIVNLSLGSKIVSIQTLKKSLEMVRINLENENETSKQTAFDVLRMLTSLLQNPEFAKSDGYDDFKEKVFGFSYKISGSERLYGFTQMQTFFDDKKGSIPPRVTKEFFKLLNLLGHGPGGSNGDCLRFDGVSPSFYELSRTQTYEEDGKIVTKKTETLDNTSNMNGFGKQLSKLGEASVANESDEKEKKGEGETSKNNEETKTGANAEAEAGAETGSQAPKEESPVKSAVNETGEGETATAPTSTNTNEETASSTTGPQRAPMPSVNPNVLPLKKEKIEEIDAIDSLGNAYKAYLIRRFIFKDLQDINLVHYMGWGTASDEYIPEPQASTRIFKRGENTKIQPKTGSHTSVDDTLDKVMTLYAKEDMAKLEEKAKAKAEEYKKNEKELEYSRKLAAEITATAAATTAVQQQLSKNSYD